MSDPYNPELVGNNITKKGGKAWGVSTLEIRGNIYALLAYSNAGLKISDAGLKIIEVNNPENPVVVGRISTWGEA